MAPLSNEREVPLSEETEARRIAANPKMADETKWHIAQNDWQRRALEHPWQVSRAACPGPQREA